MLGVKVGEDLQAIRDKIKRERISQQDPQIYLFRSHKRKQREAALLAP
jgi:hypothetical protein